jgi:hypothetical protein
MTSSRVLLVEPHDPDVGLARSLSMVDPIVTLGARLVWDARRRSPLSAPPAPLPTDPAEHRPRKKSIQNP